MEKAYSSIMCQWLVFCAERDCNSDEPSVISVLSFLTSLFERGIGYSQINKARSALSVLYPDMQIGRHSLISRFLHGVRNLCTPQPKYPFPWDVKDVLHFLTNWTISPLSSLWQCSCSSWWQWLCRKIGTTLTALTNLLYHLTSFRNPILLT